MSSCLPFVLGKLIYSASSNSSGMGRHALCKQGTSAVQRTGLKETNHGLKVLFCFMYLTNTQCILLFSTNFSCFIMPELSLVLWPLWPSDHSPYISCLLLHRCSCVILVVLRAWYQLTWTWLSWRPSWLPSPRKRMPNWQRSRLVPSENSGKQTRPRSMKVSFHRQCGGVHCRKYPGE